MKILNKEYNRSDLKILIIQKQESSKMYIIYGSPGCGFCLEAKRLLLRLEIDYTAIDISDLDEQDKQQLQEIAGIQFRTVPQIFQAEGNKMDYIGGFKELKIKLSGEQ